MIPHDIAYNSFYLGIVNYTATIKTLEELSILWTSKKQSTLVSEVINPSA